MVIYPVEPPLALAGGAKAQKRLAEADNLLPGTLGERFYRFKRLVLGKFVYFFDKCRAGVLAKYGVRVLNRQ